MKLGDRISVEGRHGRSGVIAEVLGGPGHEHYLVRWDNGEESAYYAARHAGAPPREALPVAQEAAEQEAPPKPRLTAEPGDRLVIHGHHQGEPERDAEILETRGAGGSPPFRVRWSDTGHEAILYPGADAAVEHIVRQVRRRA